MPVTPNIQILRILEKRPFSTRSRDERRLRSHPSVTHLRPCTPPPTSYPQTIYLGQIPVTILNHDPSELNIQSQQSPYLASDSSRSLLNRLRHKTSKWFTNKRAAKGMSTVSDTPHAFLFLCWIRTELRFRQFTSQSFGNIRLTCFKGSERDDQPSPSDQNTSRRSRRSPKTLRSSETFQGSPLRRCPGIHRGQLQLYPFSGNLFQTCRHSEHYLPQHVGPC
jgi:hypothetical protein